LRERFADHGLDGFQVGQQRGIVVEQHARLHACGNRSSSASVDQQTIGRHRDQAREALVSKAKYGSRGRAERLEHTTLLPRRLFAGQAGQFAERDQRQGPAAPAGVAEQPARGAFDRCWRRVRQHLGDGRVGQQQPGAAG